MHKLLISTALAAGLLAAAPAHAGFWSAVTNYFTKSAPYTPTTIDYRGPMARPSGFTVGGVSFSAYPAQTENAISYARRTGRHITYVQGASGTVSKVIINGITYPGVRLYYRSSTSTSTSRTYMDADGDIRSTPTGTQYTDADGDIRFR